MKIWASSFSIVLFVFVFLSCKNTTKKEVVEFTVEEAETIPDNTRVEKIEEDYVLGEEPYEPEDEEIREFGIIETIEDGGYPLFVVTINFVEREMKQDFNLNIEAIDMDMEQLTQLTDSWATIYYTSELQNDLHDLHFNNASLFGEYAPEMDDSWKQIIGILSGASAPTTGDLPDTVTITADDGTKEEFLLFIDDETVKANGKEVAAFYGVRGVNTITRIEPSGD